MFDHDTGNMMADSYEDWLRFQFFDHKKNKKIAFNDDNLPEGLSFIEEKFKEYCEIDVSLFNNCEKFIILSIYEIQNVLRSFIFKDNKELEEFLVENKSFVPYSFYKESSNGYKFTVRGLIDKEITTIKELLFSSDMYLFGEVMTDKGLIMPFKVLAKDHPELTLEELKEDVIRTFLSEKMIVKSISSGKD